MVKIDSPYTIVKFDMSSLAHSDGNARYCVRGPGIVSDYNGTFPRSLSGMEYSAAQDLKYMLDNAYNAGQRDRSLAVRKMFQDLVGLD
jgi:hypothetical protein